MTTSGQVGQVGRVGTKPDRWRAVTMRDRAADGTFVYAVQSTGIYCRPSCPSRRPDRSRVAFFDSPREAEASGFRACKRCRPREAAADPWVERIRRACAHLAAVEGQPSLARLAALVGVSPSHLQKHFKRLTGVSPREFADATRLAKLKRGLRGGQRVTAAMLDAGYGSSSRLYERAVTKLGMTPTAYGKGGAGLTIRYVLAGSPLGRLLVAATPRGVCAVAMAATDDELRRMLRDEYPAASIEEDPRGLSAWTKAVLERMDGRSPRGDLPLDVRATAFQWRVWTALAAVPVGQTRTYTEIARMLGEPRSARAVARACATNPVAVAIPCHRVVPAAGGHGGYRWGPERKAQLLAAERDRASQGKMGKMRD